MATDQPEGTAGAVPAPSPAARPTGPAPGRPATPGPGRPAGPPTVPGGDPPRRPRTSLVAAIERPPDPPPDPWAAFAAGTDRPPPRWRRTLRAAGRVLLHEYAVACWAALAAAVALTWPALRHPAGTLPQDLGEPARQAWQVAWLGHALRTDPAALWQGNAGPWALTGVDALLGWAPAGLVGSGPHAAALRYHLLLVAAAALLAVGGYALARQLGAGRTGGAVAAAALLCAPWRAGVAGHLDLAGTGGVVLALAMLARGHGWSLRHGRRPGRRHTGWAAAGWSTALWQLSLGLSTGLPFVLLLALVAALAAGRAGVRRLRGRRGVPLPRRLLLTDVLGGSLLLALGVLLALPSLRAGTPSAAGPVPPPWALLVAPEQARLWGAAHAPARAALADPAGMALLPGYVLYALALLGTVFSVWRRRQRVALAAAAVAAAAVTLGAGGGGWPVLREGLPAGLVPAAPGRTAFWLTLPLALLAAGAVAELARRMAAAAAGRVPARPGPAARLAVLLPVLLLAAEGWPATPQPAVPEPPAALRAVAGPALVLPTSPADDPLVLLWSTDGFPALVNGAGPATAARTAALRRAVTAFPDAGSVAYLRGLGVRTVVLVRDRVAGTPWERAGSVPVEALGIGREDRDGAVLFLL